MKRKGLYFLIALALGGVGAVHAQDTTAPAPADTTTTTTTTTETTGVATYDNRWYIAPTVGGYYNDTKRDTNSRQFYYGLGFGTFITPNISIDAFVDRTKREIDNGPANGGGHNANNSWASNAYGVAGRFYYGDWNAWRPYLLAGVMADQHISSLDHGFSPAVEVGVGVSKTITDSTDVRLEAGYRYDFDDDSIPNRNGYGDEFLGLSIVSRFGAPAAAPAPVAPPPPPPPPEVKCPNVPPGPIVGPDGCPQKVVIDLRGVNFKFDRPKKGETNIAKTLAEPSADSISILDQAVDTLQRYPQVHVTVAGYTDGVGTADYNQKLSERRAQIVYTYLTSHGIDASRLEGPIGHGMNDPIGDNSTDAGRAQNRRTELQVQQ